MKLIPLKSVRNARTNDNICRRGCYWTFSRYLDRKWIQSTRKCAAYATALSTWAPGQLRGKTFSVRRCVRAAAAALVWIVSSTLALLGHEFAAYKCKIVLFNVQVWRWRKFILIRRMFVYWRTLHVLKLHSRNAWKSEWSWANNTLTYRSSLRENNCSYNVGAYGKWICGYIDLSKVSIIVLFDIQCRR